MIFISYQSGQLPLAQALVGQLEARGVHAWYAHRDIPPGAVWDEAIMDAIVACDAFVLLFSDGSDGSLQVKREVMLAEEEGKPVFWLKTDAAQPRKLRYYLIARQWAEWDPAGDLPDSLVAQFRAATPSIEPAPAPAPAPAVPMSPLDVAAHLDEQARAAESAADPHAPAEAWLAVVAAYADAGASDTADALEARHHHARWLHEAGDPAALGEAQQLLADRTRILGSDHLDTLWSRVLLGLILGTSGDHGGALREFAAAAEGRARALGADHPDTLDARALLAEAMRETGDLAGALRETRAVFEVSHRSLGPDAVETLGARFELACLLGETGAQAEALSEFRTVAESRARNLGADHADTLNARLLAAACLAELGEAAAAVREARAVHEALMRTLGADDPASLDALDLLADCLDLAGQQEAALVEYQALVAARKRILGAQDPLTKDAARKLAALKRRLTRAARR